MSPATQTPVNQRDEFLLNLHIAEYNALTGRNASLMVIQSNIWIIIVATWGALATALPLAEKWPIISWISAIAVQFELLLMGFATNEIYRNAYYIENDLHPLVKELTQDEKFWGYEAYLKQYSGKKPLFSDLAPICVSIATSLMVLILRHAQYKEFIYGSIPLCTLTIFVNRLTYKVVRSRKRLERAAQSNGVKVKAAAAANVSLRK
jgi:predicted lactoylglutathione lyase